MDGHPGYSLASAGFSYQSPYVRPGSLDELAGPVSGTVKAGSHITGTRYLSFDVDDESQLWDLYSVTVRDGTVRDQRELLNKEVLIRMWPVLNLPQECRQEWESHFAELRVRTRWSFI
ncbi:hypothetical protein GCM10028784_33220 [Myceligenerans cantabricum]